jgi:hypothetical protein
VSGVECGDGFVHPKNSFQSFRFSREAREKIAVHSLCAKENWKGHKRRDASKGQNARFRRNVGVRTFTKWLTLWPKNGRTFSLCTIWMTNADFSPSDQHSILEYKKRQPFGQFTTSAKWLEKRAVARRCGTFVEERLPQHPCQAFVKEGADTLADRSHTRSRAEDGSTIHLAVFLLGS